MSTRPSIIILIVIILGLIAAGGTLGLYALIEHGKTGNELAILAAITSGALGSLGTLLASTHSAPPDSKTVTLTTETTDPKL